MALHSSAPDYEDVAPYGVSRESFDLMVGYNKLLFKWQRAINLVSPKSMNDAWRRHFVDSVQVLAHLPSDSPAVIVDLGSGGGFAGLVVAMCRPDLQVHLVDSDMRKCQFLRTVSRESSLANAHVHNERVENVLSEITPDYITARGFAALGDILSFAHEAYPSGIDAEFVLLKGVRYEEEIEAARQKFTFQCDEVPSITDPSSRILRIKNVCKSFK